MSQKSESEFISVAPAFKHSREQLRDANFRTISNDNETNIKWIGRHIQLFSTYYIMEGRRCLYSQFSFILNSISWEPTEWLTILVPVDLKKGVLKYVWYS